MQQAAAPPVCLTEDFLSLMQKADVRWHWVLDTVAHPDEWERNTVTHEVYVSRRIPEAKGKRLFVVYEERSDGAVPIRLHFRND